MVFSLFNREKKERVVSSLDSLESLSVQSDGAFSASNKSLSSGSVTRQKLHHHHHQHDYHANPLGSLASSDALARYSPSRGGFDLSPVRPKNKTETTTEGSAAGASPDRSLSTGSWSITGQPTLDHDPFAGISCDPVIAEEDEEERPESAPMVGKESAHSTAEAVSEATDMAATIGPSQPEPIKADGKNVSSGTVSTAATNEESNIRRPSLDSNGGSTTKSQQSDIFVRNNASLSLSEGDNNNIQRNLSAITDSPNSAGQAHADNIRNTTATTEDAVVTEAIEEPPKINRSFMLDGDDSNLAENFAAIAISPISKVTQDPAITIATPSGMVSPTSEMLLPVVSPQTTVASSASSSSADTRIPGQEFSAMAESVSVGSGRTMQSGIMTSDSSSSLVSSSQVCLSLLETPISAQEKGRPANALVQQSLTRQLKFHLARNDGGARGDANAPHATDETLINLTSSEDGIASSTVEETLQGQVKDLNVEELHGLALKHLVQYNIEAAIILYSAYIASTSNKTQKTVGKEYLQHSKRRADILSRLSTLCLLTGRVKEALTYSRLAQVERRAAGAKPLQEAVSCMELGLAFFACDNLSGALKYWREAMQMACLVLGNYDHPLVAILLNNIGVLHLQTGDFAAAQRVLDESVALQRTYLRSVTGSVENELHQLAITIGNLATASAARHSYDCAIAHFHEASALFDSVFTFKSDGVQGCIGMVLEQLQATPRPGPPLLQVRSTSSVASEPDSMRSSSLFGECDGIPTKLSPMSVDSHDFLLLGSLDQEWTPAQTLSECVMCWFGRSIGREKTADVSFDDSLKEATSTRASMPVDIDDLNVVDAEQYLNEIQYEALIHLDCSEIDDALDVFEGALKSHRDKFGNEHHLVGRTLHNMGIIAMFGKRYSQAQTYFEEAVGIRRAVLNGNHPDLCASQVKLGLVQFAKDDLESAGLIFLDIHDGLFNQNVPGHGHPQLSKIMNNVGAVLYSQGDIVGASQSFEIALEYQRRHDEDVLEEYDANSLAKAYILANLGFVCAKQGELEKSLQYHEGSLASFANFKKRAGNQDPFRLCVVSDNYEHAQILHSKDVNNEVMHYTSNSPTNEEESI